MATETHDAVSACLDSGGGAVGMPQLCGDWFGNQIFWLAIALIVLYFILSRIALPRIAAVLAERQGTITNDLMKVSGFPASRVSQSDALFLISLCARHTYGACCREAFKVAVSAATWPCSSVAPNAPAGLESSVKIK